MSCKQCYASPYPGKLIKVNSIGKCSNCGYQIRKRDMKKNFDTLEVGKRYRARNGEIVEIVILFNVDRWPFSADDGCGYTPEGRWYDSTTKSSYDLIELVEDEMIVEYYKWASIVSWDAEDESGLVDKSLLLGRYYRTKEEALEETEMCMDITTGEIFYEVLPAEIVLTIDGVEVELSEEGVESIRAIEKGER